MNSEYLLPCPLCKSIPKVAFSPLDREFNFRCCSHQKYTANSDDKFPKIAALWNRHVHDKIISLADEKIQKITEENRQLQEKMAHYFSAPAHQAESLNETLCQLLNEEKPSSLPESVRKLLEKLQSQERTLRFVERAVNHHATNPKANTADVLSTIQHHPSISDITRSYVDGVIPPTHDPYSVLQAMLADLKVVAHVLSDASLCTERLSALRTQVVARIEQTQSLLFMSGVACQ